MMRYLKRSIAPQDQYRRWIDPRLRTLRVADVVVYLQQRGWKPLPPDRKGLRAFQEPTGECVDSRPLCQFVPESEAFDNYAQLMFELLTGVADYEDRQASEVIDDILRQAAGETANGPGAGQGQDAVASRS
jgi:hypothetical protein